MIKITTPKDTEIHNVRTLSIEGAKYNWTFVSGLADQMIELTNANGRSIFIAAQIASAITTDTVSCLRHSFQSVRWGYGGRRYYIKVTEELIDEFLTMSSCAGGSIIERERNQEIEDFSMLLIDIL